MRLQTLMQRTWEEPEVEEACRPRVVVRPAPGGGAGNAQDEAATETPAAATQASGVRQRWSPGAKHPRDDPRLAECFLSASRGFSGPS